MYGQIRVCIYQKMWVATDQMMWWYSLTWVCPVCVYPLRKHAYSNILKISPPKTASFQIQDSDFFYISAQNIDCGYLLELPHWGSSNKYPQSMVLIDCGYLLEPHGWSGSKEYPQSMFLSRNKKNNVYPYKLQFYYIKVGFKGIKII